MEAILFSALCAAATSVFLQFCYEKERIFRPYYAILVYYCLYKYRPRYYTEVSFKTDKPDFEIKDEGLRYSYFRKVSIANILKNGDKFIKIETRLLYPLSPRAKFLRWLAKPLGLCEYCQNAWVALVTFIVLFPAEPFYHSLFSIGFAHFFIKVIYGTFNYFNRL